MTSAIQHLEGLVDLAKQPSSAARQKLLKDVTDLFMEETSTLNEQEVEYFGDIMSQLVVQMETEVRRHIAETIADVDTAPERLVNQLANDEIEVAKSVLAESNVLTDHELLAIVKQKSQEHLLEISKRRVVSEPVANSLAHKGNNLVLGSLARNEGAVLSQDTVKTMAQRSDDPESIGKSLMERADFSPELTEALFEHVSSAVRDKILAESQSIDETQVDGVIEEAWSWLSGQYVDRNHEAAENFIRRKISLNQLNNALLARLIKEGEIWKFASGLAHLANLDWAIVRKAILDASGERLAVICKAIDFPRHDFEDVIHITDIRKQKTQEEKLKLFGIFGGMQPENAQRALRFLRVRKSTQKSTQNAASSAQA